MNKRNQKMLVLMAVVLSVATMMAGCGQEAAQEPQITVPATEVPVITAPEETTLPEETEVIVTFPEVEAPEAGNITYGEYLELTVKEQQAYYENFETPDAFFAWMEAAKLEYEAAAETAPTMDVNEDGIQEIPVENQSGIAVGEESLEDLEWE